MTVDFTEIMDIDIDERETCIAEMMQSDELNEMADMVEAKDVDGEFEDLVEMARQTADHNPLSETAIDITEQLTDALKELR